VLGRLNPFARKRELSSFDNAITRERLIQSARLIIVDDETPLLIEELRRAGFAVDHDTSGSDLKNFDSQIYDVAIIDYHGVGQRLGTGQGLEILKHVRRVSPRTRLVAYTSRSLTAAESEFFRLSHAVLPKDLGLGDSLALVENEVRRAFAKQHLFDALVQRLSVHDQSQRERLEKALVKALTNRDESTFRNYIAKLVGQAAEKTVEIIVSKMF
jgi:ActR/RegA family two-component response regulator